MGHSTNYAASKYSNIRRDGKAGSERRREAKGGEREGREGKWKIVSTLQNPAYSSSLADVSFSLSRRVDAGNGMFIAVNAALPSLLLSSFAAKKIDVFAHLSVTILLLSQNLQLRIADFREKHAYDRQI